MKLMIKIAFLLLITFTILRWPEVAKASTGQLVCNTSAINQCMAPCGQMMTYCTENAKGPMTEWCIDEDVYWYNAQGEITYSIQDVDCYTGENSPSGETCVEGINSCKEGCFANNCYYAE